MTKGEIALSIVIPICNEKDNIQTLYEEICSATEQWKDATEIIFVDDGSADGSCDVLYQLRQSDGRIKVIEFSHNFGKSAALSAGFNETSGRIVITLDGDRQDDPAEIPNLIAQIDAGYDMVCAWRRKRHDRFIKKLASRFFNCITSLATGIRLHDFNCGLKAYRKEVLEVVTIYGELHRFIPVLVQAKGFRIIECAVNHRRRTAGKSKFGVRRYVSGLLDLITVLFLTQFFKKPAHFFGSLALFLSFIGLTICSYITYLRFVYGNIQNRYPLLFLGILLIIVGVQLFCTGLLAEMTAYTSRKKDAGYVIKRIEK